MDMSAWEEIYKDSPEGFGIVFNRQFTGLLQVISDGEELLEAQPGYINDMGRSRNRSVLV